MKILTVEQFQENFDEYFDKVENGESFMIQSEHGDAIIIPYKDPYKKQDDNVEELIRIHTDHEEGS